MYRRAIHVSQSALAAKRQGPAVGAVPYIPGLELTEEELEGEEDTFNDTSSIGHEILEQQRQALHYMRLIEHEMPQLVAFRKPFVPPSNRAPIVVRSVDYGEDAHPGKAKRVLVVPLSRLALRNEHAIHKAKLIAGVRWSPEPPRDSGIGDSEEGREQGYIKIACEDFPEAEMNLKWASDVLDRLVEEANNEPEAVADIPQDTRHLDMKLRKAKKGEHRVGPIRSRPSLRDFPNEWLPSRPIYITP
ncbi:hypothetical protein PUNSTDRAFT_58341 [Punctularia strigosozonata HHB-11173 SS5]|uniref:uncharacterized protein n=1 Tax=Punctularia strigosozonata (strain HHB-11173) TaxID=741275 RepID=UPI0004416DC5|nr:uncharacterized protein PUNSTDRAFT_58341 [Punctularia strigosozonata HHB-11173 SS5]EIN14127.1 hypothetical protein PUNSTDRAFT_58341 [Punctularia strigosozonata HHB-11173 SS5]